MLWTDGRVVQTSGYRLRLLHLPMGVLKQQGVASMKNARTAVDDGGGVLAQILTDTAGLYPKNIDLRVSKEWMKEPNRIRATADAGNDRVG